MFTALFAAAIVIAIFVPSISASAASVTSLKAPVFVEEAKYESGATHPYNKQTNTLIVDWKDVKNAKKYKLYIKGGEFGSNFVLYKTVTSSTCTVTGLERCTNYKFRVRAINGDVKSPYSETITLKTARMDFDEAGWKAMCRIVFHEVGGINDDRWDEPIVWVSDCVVNTYVGAKYTNNKVFVNYYKKYNSIQDIIYKSGGFLSDAALTRRGATYSKVPDKVKTAVYGAVYAKATYKGIKNDFNVYYWCNMNHKVNSSKVSHSFALPWGGYGYIWNTYWG
ncbi:MAG: fibronectin type III domain-containing protein [Ruminococcus sp.]|nr:fibronectin type III domain-containing protein [Ruminococcus sp.]